VIKLDYPKDFDNIKTVTERSISSIVSMDILRAYIPIEITHNYDITASVEFEYDEGLFTLKLSEI
jgi:hypothetical protein